MVYLALLPIIAGVGIASLKEVTFTWPSFIFASLSNQAAALKNVSSKGVMKKAWVKQLGPQVISSAISLLAFLTLIPIALFYDFYSLQALSASLVMRKQWKEVIWNTILSGIAFFVYNTASFQALAKLSPVTHSVANTIKRVVIIMITNIVFHTPMTILGGVGSLLAILVSLLMHLFYIF